MNVPSLCSPHVKTGGIVYLARMLDKIRLLAAGDLPEDYRANLGGGFDESCCLFLGIDYAALAEQTNAGASDDDVLAWALQHGRKPDERDVLIWNEFMRKRGWNDEASPRLASRKQESGFPGRDDIQTLFDYIDLDEGRDPATGAR